MCAAVPDASRYRGCNGGRMANGNIAECFCKEDGCNNAYHAHVSIIAFFGTLISAFTLIF